MKNQKLPQAALHAAEVATQIYRELTRDNDPWTGGYDTREEFVLACARTVLHMNLLFRDFLGAIMTWTFCLTKNGAVRVVKI